MQGYVAAYSHNPWVDTLVRTKLGRKSQKDTTGLEVVQTLLTTSEPVTGARGPSLSTCRNTLQSPDSAPLIKSGAKSG